MVWLSQPGTQLTGSFYSGSDYFKQAWYSLKYKTFDINIPLALGILVMFLTQHLPGHYQAQGDTSISVGGPRIFLLTGKWYQHVAITIFLF